MDVVVELAADLLGCRAAYLLQHLGGEPVGQLQVLGPAGSADPAERAEPVVEEHGTHDVLHVGGIAEASALAHHGGTGARSLQQKSIAVVEEVHAAPGELVDGIGLPAKRFLHALAEAAGLLGHHLVGRFVAQADGIVTARPRIVQRSLIGTEVDGDFLGGEPLPKVDDIADVSQRNDLFPADCLPDTGHQFIQRFMQLVDPTLLVAFRGRLGVDFGDNRHDARNIARLGLGAGHAAEARRDEQHATCVAAAVRETLAGGVEHGDGGAVDNALRPDVHVGSGGHLPVLRDAEGVHPLPIVGLRVVGNDHAVGDDDARSVGMRRKQTERMTRIHDQRLTIGHL